MSDQSPWNAGGFGPAPQLPPQAYPAPPPYAPSVGGLPPGGLPPAPPRRRGVAALIIAAVVTAAIVAGLLIWSPWTNASGEAAAEPSPAASQDPAKIAEATLRQAAQNLEKASVVSYKGQFTDSDDAISPFELQTTHSGWGRGSLTTGKHTVRLLTADDNRLMKADSAYWKAQKYSTTTIKHFAGHWLDSDTDLPDLAALTDPLAPANLVKLMLDAANRGHVTPGTETTLSGIRTKRLYTPSGRFYVTASAPYTLVRIQSAASSSDDTSSGPLPLPDGTDATVTELSDTSRTAFTTAYRKDLAALTTAVDPDVTFSTVGKAAFSPCGNSSCTAKFSIENLVYDPNGTTASGTVNAVITIDIKLDGRQVKHCTFHRTMKANGKVSLTCKATYSASVYSDHTVRGLPDAWARAVPDSEIKQLKDGFAADTAGTGTGAAA